METCRRFIQKYSLIPEFILCGLFFYFVWMKCGLWFETNDDLIINDLLRGAITGKPEYHTIYNSVILTAPLSLLYRIAPTIPWWGGFLLVCNGISILIPLDAIVKKSKDLFTMFCGGFAVLACLLPSLYIRGRLQYTSTAMLLAIAGFVALVLYENVAGIWLFGILEFLAFIIRPEAMEIILPIGFGLLLVATSITEEDFILGIKKILISLGIALLILAIGYGVKFLVYSGNEWTASKDFEAGRQEMFDYTGIVDYDRIDELYKRGVTKEEYDAFSHSLVLDYEHLAQTVRAASYVSKSEVTNPGILETIKWVYAYSYLNVFPGFTWLSIALGVAWCALLIASILRGRIKSLIAFVLIYLVNKGITWGYIYFKGRMPERIMLPLYFLELLSIVVMLLLFINDERRENYLRLLIIPVIAAMAYVCFVSGKQQFGTLSKQSESLPILREMESEISNYCREHNHNKFILSTYIYSNYRRSVFDVGVDNPDYVYAGGWFSCLPSVKARTGDYLESGYVYLITTAESINGNVEAEQAFLNQRYDYKLEKEDELNLVTGGKAVVYRVR